MIHSTGLQAPYSNEIYNEPSPLYLQVGELINTARREFITSFSSQFAGFLTDGYINRDEVVRVENALPSESNPEQQRLFLNFLQAIEYYEVNRFSGRDAYVPSDSTGVRVILAKAEQASTPAMNELFFDESTLYEQDPTIMHVGDIGGQRRHMSVGVRHIIGEPRRQASKLTAADAAMGIKQSHSAPQLKPLLINSIDAIISPQGALSYVVTDETEALKVARALNAGQERIHTLKINLQQGVIPKLHG
jgi:hypothetical protein